MTGKSIVLVTREDPLKLGTEGLSVADKDFERAAGNARHYETCVPHNLLPSAREKVESLTVGFLTAFENCARCIGPLGMMRANAETWRLRDHEPGDQVAR